MRKRCWKKKTNMNAEDEHGTSNKRNQKRKERGKKDEDDTEVWSKTPRKKIERIALEETTRNRENISENWKENNKTKERRQEKEEVTMAGEQNNVTTELDRKEKGKNMTDKTINAEEMKKARDKWMKTEKENYAENYR